MILCEMLRLELYFSGWTPWVGNKNSLSTLTTHIDVTESPLPPDENHEFNPDDNQLGFKRRYIIGLT